MVENIGSAVKIDLQNRTPVAASGLERAVSRTTQCHYITDIILKINSLELNYCNKHACN